MARYTGPQWKKSRRLGFSTLETGKELAKRPYAPGQHGQKRKKPTEYGLQLAEKQKVRHMESMKNNSATLSLEQVKWKELLVIISFAYLNQD